MTIEDYEEIHALWLSTPGMGLNETDDSKIGVENYLRRNPTTCFVAEDENEIIGVMMSGHDGRRGFIYHTVVKTSKRNQGIGSALVDAAMAALDSAGMNKVALVVFNKNEQGNNFWEKRGFSSRGDLVYRNKNINHLQRIDT